MCFWPMMSKKINHATDLIKGNNENIDNVYTTKIELKKIFLNLHVKILINGYKIFVSTVLKNLLIAECYVSDKPHLKYCEYRRETCMMRDYRWFNEYQSHTRT